MTDKSSQVDTSYHRTGSTRTVSRTAASTSRTAASSSVSVDSDDYEDDTVAESLHTYAPRKSCCEIAPGIERLVNETEKQQFLTHVRYFQKFLARHRIPNVERHIEHLVHFDRSDKMQPHGEISKAIYNSIAESRNFDAYARPLYLSRKKLEEYKERHKQHLLGKKYRYTRPPDESEEIRKSAYPVFDHDLPVKKKPITTERWKVGVKENYQAPVGFARAPGNILNSEGRESYYSYDGEWKAGMMHGEGYYLFSDGMGYRGEFKNNNCEGKGRAEYPVGSSYEGEWRKGKFHGEGLLECNGGTRYQGSWKWGKRWGKGRLELPCGLVYEGEWADGMPHGRGMLVSKVTGYKYEGSFEKGSIEGSGVVTTPPPESKRIVRFWPHVKEGLTLAGVIRLLKKEREDFYHTQNKNKEIMFAPKRKLFLDDYVQQVRTELHEQRAIEKREKLNAQIQAVKEQKEKLREAKLRALAGDADDEAENDGGLSDSDEEDDDDGDLSDES
mmetsp:Transcript_12564/g.18978  ORF Transcript_12564/g.18978 Transcript_12564/m.18978 type:complete len:500 (+) Transcript_12564:91-1590(+)